MINFVASSLRIFPEVKKKQNELYHRIDMAIFEYIEDFRWFCTALRLFYIVFVENKKIRVRIDDHENPLNKRIFQGVGTVSIWTTWASPQPPQFQWFLKSHIEPMLEYLASQCFP